MSSGHFRTRTPCTDMHGTGHSTGDSGAELATRPGIRVRNWPLDERGVWGSSGHRVTGEDGTLTSIVVPGWPARIVTSRDLTGSLPKPPHTTVRTLPSFNFNMKVN